MASAGSRGAAVALPRPRSRADHAQPSDVATAAWLWAVPCAAVTIALIVLVGPPLSRVLYPATLPVLPTVEHNPEPVEDTRYLLSLLGPVLLAAGVALVAPRLRVPRRPGIALAGAAQLVGLGVVAACFVRQLGPRWRIGFFTWGQVAAAGVAAVVVALAAHRGWLTRRRPESRALRVLLPAVAVVLTGIWFLQFINTADTICTYGDCYNTSFMVDETFAVLNGLTPLVDHTAAYGSLWPFAFAPAMALLGKTLLVWTILMWALTVAMLLAIYGVLRRATRSSIGAFALFLPVMVFTFYAASRDLDHPIAIYQQVPLRTAGPFIVAWLVARRLDRGRGATWPLALAAGLAALNNADFGVAALGATVAALLWTEFPLTLRSLGRLGANVVLGLAGAFVVVAMLTLVRAGTVPNPAKAVAFARVYALSGVGFWPLLRIIGLPLAIYLTYAAAIGVATVRAVQGAPNRTLTGMLAWSGIFGLGSAAYYMGASTILGVATLFPPWGLALALLAIVAVRHTARTRERIPAVPVVAALFGFCLIATFLVMPPVRLAPWSQVERLTASLTPYAPDDAEPLAPPRDAGFRRFVSSIADGRGHFVVRRGAPVALFTATGHLLADGYNLEDVVPYTGRSVFTVQQFDDALGRLRAAGGNTVLVPALILPRVSELLVRRGFEVLTTSGPRAGLPGGSIPQEEVVKLSAGATQSELTKWVDTRALPGHR
ncbi:MAG TPA: hypothetical protein VFF79_06365 [Conexibacter sp.]|jgi:hypothetical protein|nr:hypothetical protein [Conexibacter sp.]